MDVVNVKRVSSHQLKQMPEFSYIARNATGADVVGSLTAGSQRDALAQLANRALFPLKVEAATKGLASIELRMPWQNRINTELLAANLTQLADLLQNGVPLLSALKILSEQAAHPVLREVMQDVLDQVAEGESLEVALARHPKVFSELTISMVRAGIEGAFLEDALRRTADFLENQAELKGKVTGAMAYPMFLAVMGFVVTAVLIVFFVPKFETLFTRLETNGGGLPLATTILLLLSDLFTRYAAIALVIAGAVIWAIRRYVATENGKELIDRTKLSLPIAGKILHNTALSRFCRVLGTLLRNGVPILKALRISSASTGNRLLSRAILGSAENVSAGEALSRPLAESGLIPANIMAMISVAEEANTLDTVLLNVADRIDQRIQRQLALMVRLVEPIMLVLIGGVVLFILVALLLPIMELSTTVG